MEAKILIATTNKGKIKEICEILNELPATLLTPEQLQLNLTIAETGSSYAENAALKAIAFARESGLLSVADDSGLEVETLEGAPGIYSARYAPQANATDADRRAYLLEQLQGHPRPWLARFVCVVAIATPAGKLQFSEGFCPGEIILEERGEQGFGYDPIFLLPQLGLTMAQLDRSRKNQISHRGRAFQAAYPILCDLLESPVGK
jgi:XTP/dITP diphosphohydrolase